MLGWRRRRRGARRARAARAPMRPVAGERCWLVLETFFVGNVRRQRRVLVQVVEASACVQRHSGGHLHVAARRGDLRRLDARLEGRLTQEA